MKLLFLCHAHPDLQAGGTEIFARDLFRTMRDEHGDQGVFLAGTSAGQRGGSPGTAFQAAGEAADEVLMWTAGFDPFFLSQIDLHGVVPEFVSLLRSVAPDVVHVHHTLQLGVELIPLIRRTLPSAAIVMTLHDFYALCPHDGQMVTREGALCDAPGLDACRRCFADRGATEFRLRELHIARALRAVDCFISPSRFLRDRFIANGMAPDRITIIPNGLPPVNPMPHRGSGDGRRDRFAFFGHINRFKGATVALEASARLSRDGVGHSLSLHGGTAHQSKSVLETFERALVAAPDARHRGAYRRADHARLIAHADWVVVPSIWWENAPLVIQEAFAHRRPVIASDIGGMAEAVTSGVNGLTAPVGDAGGFAAVMRRAVEEPGLWARLVEGIAPPVAIAQSARMHRALYEELLCNTGTRRVA